MCNWQYLNNILNSYKMVGSTYLSVIILNANVINSSIKRHRMDTAALLLSLVQLFVSPWTVALQAPCSTTRAATTMRSQCTSVKSGTSF